MLWSNPLRQWWLERGAAARRRHAAWLEGAMARGFGGRRGLPRIPVRAVDEGGFGPVLARPGGRAWAEDWWGATLARDDLDVERA